MPALYRPPPRARGDQPAGFRGTAHDRPQGPSSGKDAGRGRPQRADVVGPQARHQQERGKPHPDRGAGPERGRFRRRILFGERRPPRHRPHHRPGAGLYAARHDDRLRRQPHLDARRLRRAGARHRHVGGRACARHPDADPEESQEHAGARRRRSCRTASPQRTSSLPSSARSARRAAPATSSNMRAKRSARCRWKAA